ncbi:hypothetical protein MTO96_028356 [Rhipicephalus appendiculatus]
MSLCADFEHGSEYAEGNSVEHGVPYSLQSVQLSGSTSPPEPKCTTVQTRSRSQILVAHSPSRLPYMAVCSVGLLMVVVGVAVTTYKLHVGGAIMVMFNHSMELLRRGANGSVNGGGGGDDIGILAGADGQYHLAKHERKKLTQSSCKSDVCVWAENYLRGRLNSSVSPCTDFYAHVCSRHWAAQDLDVQSRAYRERASWLDDDGH